MIARKLATKVAGMLNEIPVDSLEEKNTEYLKFTMEGKSSKGTDLFTAISQMLYTAFLACFSHIN